MYYETMDIVGWILVIGLLFALSEMHYQRGIGEPVEDWGAERWGVAGALTFLWPVLLAIAVGILMGKMLWEIHKLLVKERKFPTWKRKSKISPLNLPDYMTVTAEVKRTWVDEAGLSVGSTVYIEGKSYEVREIAPTMNPHRYVITATNRKAPKCPWMGEV